MQKTLGKPGFLSKGFNTLTERTGTELFGVFPMFLKQFERYLKRSTLPPVLSY
jgi:hypothetical protein